MKSNIKKLISLILCMSFIFTLFASFNVSAEYVPDAIVLTIYAKKQEGSSIVLPEDDKHLIFEFGHSYITIENFCQKPITVGKMSIAHNTGISIGLWLHNDSAREGIYYNRDLVENPNGYYSYSQQITESDLIKLNAFINNPAQDYWDVTHNCTHFAIGAWNTACDVIIPSFDFPMHLMNYIKTFENYQYEKRVAATYPVKYVENGVLKDI